MRILIVDDELFFRTSFETYIDWMSLGCEVVGCASNGEQALQEIERLKPDIVFLDIQMPGVNGIQVLKIAQEKYPTIKFIVLTGYNEFEYARQALRCGAVDFIHKGELGTELITKTICKLTNTKNDKIHTKLNFSNNTLSSQEYLQKFLHGLNFDTTSELKCNSLKIKQSNLFVIMFEILHFPLIQKRYQKKESLLYQGVENLFAEMLDSEELEFLFYDKQTACLIKSFSSTFSQLAMEKELLYLAQKYACAMRKFFNLEISVGISGITQQFSDLWVAMQQAQSACMIQFAFGKNVVGMYNQLQQYTLIEHLHTQGIIRNIQNHGTFSQQQLAKDIYELFCVDNPRILVTPTAARMAARNIVGSLLNKQRQVPWFVRIDDAESLEDILKILQQVFQYEYNLVLPTQKEDLGDVVKNATLWIESNISNSALSLETVAEAVCANSSYLSRKFKKETGLTITDYVNRLRVQMALSMLQHNDVMVYQIAYEVGYNNVEHFNRIFKKVTGHSPGYFKEKNK